MPSTNESINRFDRVTRFMQNQSDAEWERLVKDLRQEHLPGEPLPSQRVFISRRLLWELHDWVQYAQQDLEETHSSCDWENSDKDKDENENGEPNCRAVQYGSGDASQHESIRQMRDLLDEVVQLGVPR